MARNSMDLTTGSVTKKLIVFALPILLTNLLQQLYHAADVYVVGNFAGSVEDCNTALAAVGSTGSVTTLLLNLFLGLSMGTNVVCANLYGSGKTKEFEKAVQTSVILAAVCGLFVGAAGFLLAEPILNMMGVPETVLPHSIKYMQIIFLGQPASLLYNFCAGILRSRGDTKRPMYILTISGIINVLFNLFFVIVLDMDSAGVALATSVSHYFSAASVLYILTHRHGEYRLNLLRMRFSVENFKKIVSIGIPGGLNGIVFSVSNVVISRAVNDLGPLVIAGNAASANVDAFTFQILVAFYTACISFAGQNFGARKIHRIDNLLVSAILTTAAIYLSVFSVIAIFPKFFVGIFTLDPAVAEQGVYRLLTIGAGYFIYIISEMCIGCMRGMGKSFLPTGLNMVCICGSRLLWVAFIFPLKPSLFFLYLCFPVSYVICAAAQLPCYLYYSRKEKLLDAAAAAESA